MSTRPASYADYLSAHWPVLRHAQFKDPAYGVLALIEKWGVGTSAARGARAPPEVEPDDAVLVCGIP